MGTDNSAMQTYSDLLNMLQGVKTTSDRIIARLEAVMKKTGGNLSPQQVNALRGIVDMYERAKDKLKKEEAADLVHRKNDKEFLEEKMESFETHIAVPLAEIERRLAAVEDPVGGAKVLQDLWRPKRGSNKKPRCYEAIAAFWGIGAVTLVLGSLLRFAELDGAWTLLGVGGAATVVTFALLLYVQPKADPQAQTVKQK